MLEWRLYGDSVESDTLWRFYGKISLEIIWGFYGESIVNLITRNVRVEIVWRQCGE